MAKIGAIKTGPKRQTEEGQDDKRQRVDPPKHPTLKPHNPKKGK
jgi:hypothetical protein